MTLTAEDVWQVLTSVKDPEIPVVSVVEMGIIRAVDVTAVGDARDRPSRVRIGVAFAQDVGDAEHCRVGRIVEVGFGEGGEHGADRPDVWRHSAHRVSDTAA